MTQAAAIDELVRRGFHSVVFQPVCRLQSNRIIGFEALMRGPAGTELADPKTIFRNDAIDRDLLHRTDLACLLSSVRVGRMFPKDVLLFINMHGETLIRLSHSRADVELLLEQVNIDLNRIVLEVSELTDTENVRAIGRSLRPLRQAGMRVALDDVGARYAWLHHMLWLEPEILKIDRQFISHIDRSPRKRRLIASFVGFCADAASEVVAEGIETAEEQAALLEAGVTLGQGFYLGRPQPVQAWMADTETTAERVRVNGLVTIGEISA
jgi:EAL domain-containing protein (putative c-di-GMP-specific phosphodiesterase class I)